MYAFDFFLFCMATVGLTAILVDGKIFQPFRERLEKNVRDDEERWNSQFPEKKPPRTWSGFLFSIITCYQCCGFWSGLFCGFCLLLVITDYTLVYNGIRLGTDLQRLFHVPFFWLLCGFAGSFLSTVYLMFVEWIFAKTELCRRTNQEHPHNHEEEHLEEENVKEQ
ncbi:MAG: DUF1360 domain-containing protein [Planctomycetaceae bacterium]|jgi:hypothetical protein|nr:DUF1360 domain-containing protein [Planctomycetaceae bacterium]